MERVVEAVGNFLESTWGFLTVTAIWVIGLILLPFMGEDYVNVFNLFLSISALFMSSLLLVSGKKNSLATTAMIEELIKATKDAREDLIGLEKQSMKEIEATKDEIENN